LTTSSPIVIPFNFAAWVNLRTDAIEFNLAASLGCSVYKPNADYTIPLKNLPPNFSTILRHSFKCKSPLLTISRSLLFTSDLKLRPVLKVGVRFYFLISFLLCSVLKIKGSSIGISIISYPNNALSDIAYSASESDQFPTHTSPWTPILFFYDFLCCVLLLMFLLYIVLLFCIEFLFFLNLD